MNCHLFTHFYSLFGHFKRMSKHCIGMYRKEPLRMAKWCLVTVGGLWLVGAARR